MSQRMFCARREGVDSVVGRIIQRIMWEQTSGFGVVERVVRKEGIGDGELGEGCRERRWIVQRGMVGGEVMKCVFGRMVDGDFGGGYEVDGV